MNRLALVALALVGALPAAAQSPPYVYPITLSTVAAQILPNNPTRHRVVFINESITAIIAVCPVGPGRNGVTIVPGINNAGCVPILPGGSFLVDGGAVPGPQIFMPSAWNGIANGAAALTIYEFE